MIFNVQMPDDISKLRQQLRRAHDAAGRILRHLLRDQPMTPGSFYLQKRRCGKPNCRCARGQLHTAWVITRSQDGATRTFMVPAQDRARLRQLTAEYRRYHRAPGPCWPNARGRPWTWPTNWPNSAWSPGPSSRHEPGDHRTPSAAGPGGL